jgi:alkylation response protein AidB-like acyl-CoA dehydrogenase
MTTDATGTTTAAATGSAAAQVEDVEAFRLRARAWIQDNLTPGHAFASLRDRPDEEELAAVARDREIQRALFDAGLAGICFPKEYGGQGLTPAHQSAFNDEVAGYHYPARLQAPTMVPCAAVLLEFGSEEQKRQHLPAILKGEEIWMQMLSEPSSGSDAAGALTTAVREDDEWVLNGSKIWTTGAWWADWALVLARTNWDVPKHRGLSVFILPIHQQGVDVHRIEMLNGNREFCQEFFSDVRIPDSDRIGDVDNGWSVCTRWLFHERMLFHSPFATMPSGGRGGRDSGSALALAREVGRGDDPIARDLVGEAITLELVGDAVTNRVMRGMTTGAMNDQSAAIVRLFGGLAGARKTTIAFELAGGEAGAWADDDGLATDAGVDQLMRQSACIGGGTTEMARNVISERVLGMPREVSLDRDVPFRDVPRGSRR